MTEDKPMSPWCTPILNICITGPARTTADWTIGKVANS